MCCEYKVSVGLQSGHYVREKLNGIDGVDIPEAGLVSRRNLPLAVFQTLTHCINFGEFSDG